MFLVFDTETNDMPDFKLPADDPRQARIVEMAAALMSDDLSRIIDSFCMVAKPDGWRIADGAAKVHGISNERAVEIGVPVVQIMDRLDQMMAEAGEDPLTLCGFNVRFDNKLVRGERRRLGRSDMFGAFREFDVMRACTDICKIPPTAAMQKSGRNWFKTPKLAEAYRILCGKEMDGAHSAMIDVQATVEIMRALRRAHGIEIAGEFPNSNNSNNGKSRAAPPPKVATEPQARQAAPDVGAGNDDADIF